MLNYGKSSSNEKELTSKAVEPPVANEPDAPKPSAKKMILSTKEGNFEPTQIRGTYTNSGFAGFRVKTFTYPGLSARLRTHDQSPTILIASKSDIRALIFIVKLDKDEKNQLRALRVGANSAFSRQSGVIPDKGQIIPYDMNEEKPGLWRIKFQGNLEPGEYGIYATVTSKSSVFLILA